MKDICRIFDINAEGDFDNFDKMFASLLGPYGSKVFNVFTKNRKLILHLLNYLHDPAVSETLMGIMKAMLPEQTLTNFYSWLNEDGFWKSLGEKIYGAGKCIFAFGQFSILDLSICLFLFLHHMSAHIYHLLGADSSFEEASSFFTRLVDICSTQSCADILFVELGRDFSFVDGLVNCISNSSGNTPHEQQVACINALRTLLLKTGEQLYDTSLEGKNNFENMAISTKFRFYLVNSSTFTFFSVYANSCTQHVGMHTRRASPPFEG